MEDRSIIRTRLVHRYCGGQLFVVNVKEFQRALGDVLILCSDGCNAVADIAGRIERQHVLIHDALAETEPLHIFGSQDGMDAGEGERGGGVDGLDAGVGVRGAEDLAPQGAGQGYVERILAESGDLVRAVIATDRRSDGSLLRCCHCVFLPYPFAVSKGRPNGLPRLCDSWNKV